MSRSRCLVHAGYMDCGAEWGKGSMEIEDGL